MNRTKQQQRSYNFRFRDTCFISDCVQATWRPQCLIIRQILCPILVRWSFVCVVQCWAAALGLANAHFLFVANNILVINRKEETAKRNEWRMECTTVALTCVVHHSPLINSFHFNAFSATIKLFNLVDKYHDSVVAYLAFTDLRCGTRWNAFAKGNDARRLSRTTQMA